MPKDKLLKTFFLLVVVCTVAYFLNAYSRGFLARLGMPKDYIRLARHGFYLVWLVFMMVAGYKAFASAQVKWAKEVWKIVYVVVIVYTVASEVLGFLIPQWGFYIHSAMAHTAFIFCSPIPFFALMSIIRWQYPSQKKES